MAERKKLNWLMILQGWAMLWVVIGHAFLGVADEGPKWENALFHFAYSFHMPLFMLVSGWLFYFTRLRDSDASDGAKWSYGRIIKDKAIRLLLPGFVFSLVALALKLAFPGEMSRQVGLSWNEIVHSYVYPYDNPMRELWFIATLFWFFLLTPIWKIVLKTKWIIWVALVLLIVLHFIHLKIELLCLDRVCNYAIWFYLGLFISKEEIVDNLFSKYAWWVVFAGIAIHVIGRFTNSFIISLGGISFSFGFALLADKYIPKLFITFRNYTYQIFLMGIFAQMFVKIMYKHISIPYVGAYVLCILMGLYVPVLVSSLLEKINSKPLCLCVGLKAK